MRPKLAFAYRVCILLTQLFRNLGQNMEITNQNKNCLYVLPTKEIYKISIFTRSQLCTKRFTLYMEYIVYDENIWCNVTCMYNNKFFFVLYKNICAQRKEKRLHPRIIYLCKSVYDTKCDDPF